MDLYRSPELQKTIVKLVVSAAQLRSEIMGENKGLDTSTIQVALGALLNFARNVDDEDKVSLLETYKTLIPALVLIAGYGGTELITHLALGNIWQWRLKKQNCRFSCARRVPFHRVHVENKP